MIVVKCWYCHKKMSPGEWDWVVLLDGTLRPVCKDDRKCRAGMGIRGNGRRPPIIKLPKNKVLNHNREK